MRRSLLPGAILAVSGLLLAACGTTTPAPPPAWSQPRAGPAIALTNTELVGKWGLASYTTEEAAARTMAEAKAACSNPYVVSPGAHGGAMMYLADQAVPAELVLKIGPDGRTYIGLPGRPGDPRDREVISASNGVLTMKWVDPSVAKRYGTMVFVRCSA
jgi:hypothetical protein